MKENNPHKILNSIRNRYSPRDFLDKPIENEKINSILEAARLAPSGFNNQPWRYVLVDKKSKNRKKLEHSLLPGNGWAKSAPLLIVLFTHEKFQKSANNIPYHIYDSALSMMSLVIEAENQGLKTHQMGGFVSSKVKKSLSIPLDYDILVVCAVGYESKKLGIKSKIRNSIINKIIKHKERKKIQEIFFIDEFVLKKAVKNEEI